MQFVHNIVEYLVQAYPTDIAAFRFTQAGFERLSKVRFCYTIGDHAHFGSFQLQYERDPCFRQKSQLVLIKNEEIFVGKVILDIALSLDDFITALNDSTTTYLKSLRTSRVYKGEQA